MSGNKNRGGQHQALGGGGGGGATSTAVRFSTANSIQTISNTIGVAFATILRERQLFADRVFQPVKTKHLPAGLSLVPVSAAGTTGNGNGNRRLVEKQRSIKLMAEADDDEAEEEEAQAAAAKFQQWMGGVRDALEKGHLKEVSLLITGCGTSAEAAGGIEGCVLESHTIHVAYCAADGSATLSHTTAAGTRPITAAHQHRFGHDDRHGATAASEGGGLDRGAVMRKQRKFFEGLLGSMAELASAPLFPVASDGADTDATTRVAVTTRVSYTEGTPVQYEPPSFHRGTPADFLAYRREAMEQNFVSCDDLSTGHHDIRLSSRRPMALRRELGAAATLRGPHTQQQQQGTLISLNHPSVMGSYWSQVGAPAGATTSTAAAVDQEEAEEEERPRHAHKQHQQRRSLDQRCSPWELLSIALPSPSSALFGGASVGAAADGGQDDHHNSGSNHLLSVLLSDDEKMYLCCVAFALTHMPGLPPPPPPQAIAAEAEEEQQAQGQTGGHGDQRGRGSASSASGWCDLAAMLTDEFLTDGTCAGSSFFEDRIGPTDLRRYVKQMEHCGVATAETASSAAAAAGNVSEPSSLTLPRFVPRTAGNVKLLDALVGAAIIGDDDDDDPQLVEKTSSSPLVLRLQLRELVVKVFPQSVIDALRRCRCTMSSVFDEQTTSNGRKKAAMGGIKQKSATSSASVAEQRQQHKLSTASSKHNTSVNKKKRHRQQQQPSEEEEGEVEDARRRCGRRREEEHPPSRHHHHHHHDHGRPTAAAVVAAAPSLSLSPMHKW